VEIEQDQKDPALGPEECLDFVVGTTVQATQKVCLAVVEVLDEDLVEVLDTDVDMGIDIEHTLFNKSILANILLNHTNNKMMRKTF
jgi:hypothetical protein